MCIRDSLSREWEGEKKWESERGEKCEETFHVWRYGYRRWTCLLYTSDAADDLLCVDLGGRRIIKKKNHIRSYCGWTPNHHEYQYSDQAMRDSTSQTPTFT